MRKIAVGPTLFVIVSHLAAVAGPILYGIYHGFTWIAGAIALAFLVLTTFSVSAGYHRLFTHGAYEAHWLLRLFLAFFGAAAFEGSVFKWVTMHRQHHQGVDTDDDPHDIKKGFWWAHIGWVVFGFGASRIEPNIDDLKKDPILRFQDRYYAAVAILSGVLLPWAVGGYFGDPWGGLCIGSFLRMVFFHHVTWFINSWAHTFGSRPYDRTITARNSFPLALLTMGEGYHNFHHVFPYDYRNGPRALDWDVTKWIVYLMSFVGLSRNLVRADQAAIDHAVLANKS
jgi:stearoyl-CoA desaturase (delta-9 desaturase)